MRELKLKLAWRALEADFEHVQGAPTPVDAELVNACEEDVRAAFAALPTFAGRPVQLPPDLRDFYLLAQDKLHAGPRSSPSAGRFLFYAVTWLASDGLHLADEAEGDSAPWLEIGAFDEASWVFICCDPEDDMFGAVLRCDDETPWSRAVYPLQTFLDLRTFLDHLAG